MWKPRLIIVLRGGLVQEIIASPKLKDIQVVIKDLDVSESDDHPTIAVDESGEKASWSMWEGSDFTPLEDELYEFIDRLMR